GRMAMTGTRGLEFLLDLENAVALRGGDALVLDDNRLIEVVAAPEPLFEIRCSDPHHLIRIAWHLGNRHLPTQIIGKGLRIRRDHVIEAMVKGLGARVIESEAAALYRLLTWLSPSFPVGGFSYSSGIEWAVEAGDITEAASLRAWLASMLADGPGFCDGVFLAQVHRAAEFGNDAGLRDIVELAAAFVGSRERQLETSAQGRAFIEIARSAWSCDGLEAIISRCEGTIVYPVAVGLVSAAHAIPLAPTPQAFLHALTSNWISAATRL